MVGAQESSLRTGAVVAAVVVEAAWHPAVPLGICALTVSGGDTGTILLQGPWRGEGEAGETITLQAQIVECPFQQEHWKW